MRTYSAKLEDIQKQWWIIDAENLILGRLAAHVSMLVRGRHKPIYSSNLDCGDKVIIINAEKIIMTGKKLTDKKYYRHTGYPSGVRETTPAKLISEGKANRIVELAVQRMLPKTIMGRDQLRNLRVYNGVDHEHEAQNPKEYDFAKMNSKNKR